MYNQSNSQHSPRKFRITGLIVVALGYFLYTISHRVLLLFTGVVISIAMESLIGFLHQKTGKRRLAILLSYLFLIGLLLSGVLIMIPFLVNQIGDMVGVIVDWANGIQNILQTNGLVQLVTNFWLYDYIKSFGIDLAEPKYLSQLQTIIQNNISVIVSFSSSYAKDAGGIVVNTVGGILSAIAQIGFVMTLSVLLSIEKIGFIHFLHRLIGKSTKAHEKLDLLYKKLGFWLRTQLLLGLYIGVMMRVVLRVLSWFGLDLPNKGSLAVISALTELIPYLGPMLGGIPVLILSGIGYGWVGILVGGLVVFCVQWIENNVLIPILFKQSLGISPVVVFLCMILGGLTIGINGVILAIPIAVIITILFSADKDGELQ